MGMGSLREEERKKSSNYGTLRQVESQSTPSYTPSYGGGMGAVRQAESPATPSYGSIRASERNYTPSDMARYSIDSSNAAIARASAPTPSMGAVRQAESPVSASMGSVRATERSMPTTSGSSSKSSRSSGSSSDRLFIPITPGQSLANELYGAGVPSVFATGAGLISDVLGAGVVGAAAKSGAQAVRTGLSQILPRFSPAVAAAAQRGQQAVQSGVEAAKQAASTGLGTIGQAANRLGQAVGNVTPQLVKSVSQSPVAPFTGAAIISSLTPTLGATGLSSATGEPTGVNRPTVVDTTTQRSIATLESGTMGGGYGGQGTYGGGMTAMTPSASSATGMTDMGGRIVPGPGTSSMAQQSMEQPMVQQPPYQEYPIIEQPNWQQIQQDMMSVIQQGAQQNMALVTSWLNQMTSQLDQLEAQLRQQYQQQGTVIDPATEAALKEIRSQIDLRRKQLMEEMNRRGLLQSGIWLEEENRILNNQLTAEEKLLAGRLSDIQNRLNDALMSLSKERLNMMGQAMQNQMGIQQWAMSQQMDVMQDISRRNEQWNRWWQEQLNQQRQEAENRRRWEYEQGLEKAKTIAGWTGTIPEGYPWAGQQTLEARKLESQAGKGLYSESATSRYVQQIPSYSSLQEALDDFQRFRPVMEAERADANRVLQAIYSFFGGG